MIPTPRVVPAGDGADPTGVSIPGFLVDAKAKAKKAFAHMQVEMQFLDTHENLYLELHRDFSKVAYAPQSEASLQNFQTLLIMEIGLMMGCDMDWGTANPDSAAIADTAVLPPAAGKDDGDNSEDSSADAPAAARGGGGKPVAL